MFSQSLRFFHRPFHFPGHAPKRFTLVDLPPKKRHSLLAQIIHIYAPGRFTLVDLPPKNRQSGLGAVMIKVSRSRAILGMLPFTQKKHEENDSIMTAKMYREMLEADQAHKPARTVALTP